MYILRTKIVESPYKELFYKDTAKDTEGTIALNTVVAFDVSDAKLFDRDSAIRLCNELNTNKEALKANGYSEFEVLKTGLTPFEEAARYAVNLLDKKEMFEALGYMYECNCPLYMVGNSTIDEIREYLNEWGEKHNLEEYWWEKYGSEDDALYKGYDILEDEGKILKNDE